MTNRMGSLALCAAMVLAPALATAEEEWENEAAPLAPQPEAVPPAAPGGQALAPQAQAQAQAQPQAQPQARAQPQAAVPPGQWVYTQQYGWIWMPYSDAYTQVPADGYGAPYAYVYYPDYGWTWLAAPWMWGIGPWPYFGAYGAVSFGWYGHGWWRYPGRWRYAPSYGGGYAPYGGWPRPGGWMPPAPAYRGFTYGAPLRAAPYVRGGFVGSGGGFPVRPGGGRSGGWRGHGRGRW